jgi:hypothetical protein
MGKPRAWQHSGTLAEVVQLLWDKKHDGLYIPGESPSKITIELVVKRREVFDEFASHLWAHLVRVFSGKSIAEMWRLVIWQVQELEDSLVNFGGFLKELATLQNQQLLGWKHRMPSEDLL